MVVLLFVAIWKIFVTNDDIAADFPEMEQRGTIRVVTGVDPDGYYVSADSVSGYNYQLLKSIQSLTNLKIELTLENSFEKSLEGLRSGKYDLIAYDVQMNKDLNSEFGFTKATKRDKQILVQRKAAFNNGISPIRDHLQLARKSLYVQKGDPAILRIRNLSHEIGDTIFVIENKLYNASQLAMMVASGEIDYAVCDKSVADNLAKKIEELDVETDIGFTHLESWIVRSTSPVLLDSLNVWITKIGSLK